MGMWQELTLLVYSFMQRWLEAVDQAAVDPVVLDLKGGAMVR
jgi:hypothetical protein